MRSFLVSVAMLAISTSVAAQSINERPTIIAVGQGQVTREPDFVRIGFHVRGEGVTASEALNALANQRSLIEAGVRGLKGLASVEISGVQINTQDVRNPNCSRLQPYLASQQLSTGDCAIVGSIATLEAEVRVFPASRAGDVASMASQLGAKLVGLRGAGFKDDAAIQREAVAKAALDARREAESVAQAAGVHLGPMLRLQDSTAINPAQGVLAGVPVMVSETELSPFNLPPPPLTVTLQFHPQPITRTARVSVTYALEPGPVTP